MGNGVAGASRTLMMINCTIKTAHAVPLASARQHTEDQKENQAGHSPERTVEGHGVQAMGVDPPSWVHSSQPEG